MKELAQNRRARFDIAIEETYEAGIILTGDEIKSIRANRAQLTGAYVRFMHGKRSGKALPEAVIVGSHFALAADPERTRALLLHAKEIEKIREAVEVKGQTAVPLSIHLKRGWAKVIIGVGKGRKGYDKRELLKERDIERDTRAATKGKS